jgi:hypothetical protein
MTTAEIYRYIQNNDSFHTEVVAFTKNVWMYVWNCIIDTKIELLKLRSISGKEIIKELKKRVPKVYQEFALVIIRSLLRQDK